jgi:membrane fusion protein
MTSELFRQEVLQARQNPWIGGISVATPPSRWWLVALSGSLGGVLLLFFCFGSYTRRENVTGQIVPSGGLLNVSAVNAGVVSRVLVRDGQQVQAGTPLLEISSEQGSAVLGDTHALIARQLADQHGRLDADLDTQQQATQQLEQALRGKIVLLRSQLGQMGSQIDIQRQQAQSAADMLKRVEPLIAKGYISAFQIQQQKSAMLDAQSQYKALVRQQLDLRQQIADAEQQLAKLPLDSSTLRNDTERKLADVNQSMAQNEMQRAVILRAPVDGVVSVVLPKPGQMVSVGQSLLSLLPTKSTLQAQLLVPSRAVGFIAPGNRVVLRYQSFPYQKFGQQYGRVAEVSRSALTPPEVAAVLGQSPQQDQGPLYRVQVALDHQQVQAYGKPESVKPGMALDADILMERRSLIEWSFEPLYGMARRFLGKDANAHG